MWRMLIDIARFNHFALDMLRDTQLPEKHRSKTRQRANQAYSHDQPQKKIGAYLAHEGYSNSFRDNYIIPLITALWNVHNARDALELPIAPLLRFMKDCDLLRSSLSWPKWMCVPGGINEIEAAVANTISTERVHLNTTIDSITKTDKPGWLAVQMKEGRIEYFNHVIVTTSAREALRLTSANATDEEVHALNGFQTARTVAILHSDTTSSEGWEKWDASW
ncbi:hypothetical protein ACJ72_08518 [Emergomyces africanus]|uniref:Amine oxidase domain-containing protein n=1 Tax=Emergomyces africanus TaxID=1955775 RepID=A0A1B7NKH6_9EURO|nr:hypothetical protein ACJ72_08518 [Emergomyces africanus]